MGSLQDGLRTGTIMSVSVTKIYIISGRGGTMVGTCVQPRRSPTALDGSVTCFQLARNGSTKCVSIEFDPSEFGAAGIGWTGP